MSLITLSKLILIILKLIESIEKTVPKKVKGVINGF